MIPSLCLSIARSHKSHGQSRHFFSCFLCRILWHKDRWQKSDPFLLQLISRYLIPTCFPFTSKSINETQVVCHDFRKRYCFVFSLVDVDQKLSVKWFKSTMHRPFKLFWRTQRTFRRFKLRGCWVDMSQPNCFLINAPEGLAWAAWSLQILWRHKRLDIPYAKKNVRGVKLSDGAENA